MCGLTSLAKTGQKLKKATVLTCCKRLSKGEYLVKKLTTINPSKDEINTKLRQTALLLNCSRLRGNALGRQWNARARNRTCADLPSQNTTHRLNINACKRVVM